MTSLQARQLTAAHGREQARNSVAAVRESSIVWRLLDWRDLDGSEERWLAAQLPIVQRHHTRSSGLAAQYLAAFRRLELGEPGQVVLADALDVLRVLTSLRTTGPVALKRAIGHQPAPEIAARLAFTQLSGAVTRLTAEGGRETVDRTVRADQRAVGYARIARSDACAFCAMLASRGAEYGSAEAAGGVVGSSGRSRGSRSVGESYHDHCRCTVEPSYGDWSPPPEVGLWRELYGEAATSGRSAAEVMRRFRRGLEGRPMALDAAAG